MGLPASTMQEMGRKTGHARPAERGPAQPYARRAGFGVHSDGTAIDAVELGNARGMVCRIITLGATIQYLAVPERRGCIENVVLGHATPAGYLATRNYFGATVGRCANRIAGGRFQLDGKRYRLEPNDGRHHLHGGPGGIDRALWRIDNVTSEPQPRVRLSCSSAHGAGGYPGRLDMCADFALSPDNELQIEYRAVTDRPTIANLSHHSLFNLAGESSGTDVLGHRLSIAAQAYTPVDESLIPTGELRSLAGTAFDFRQPVAVGARIEARAEAQLRYARGYDHNFVLDGVSGALRQVARLEEPVSGRVLELYSDAPGLQCYSGNFLDGRLIGLGGRAYQQHSGLALEPQGFPDAPNQPGFPSVRLDPGAGYSNKMQFRFLVNNAAPSP